MTGASDQFTFVSTPASGDLSLVARVASLQNADPWALAGLMIRESLAAGSKQLSVFVTPGTGGVVRGRAVTGGGTVQLTVGAGTPPVWLRLDRRSSTMTAYSSADGVKWTSMASVKLALNTRVTIGLAVASHSSGVTVAASFAGMLLNGLPVVPGADVPPAPAVPPPNQPPLVSLTSPQAVDSFAAPATITLTAWASDLDGSIQAVRFYNGNALLGASAFAPYSFTWLNVPAGTYRLAAVARDNLGATTVSSWTDVTVTVNAPPPQLSTAVFSPAVVSETIDYYMFEVFVATADPSTAAPLATQNLGLPPLVNGECVADVQSTIVGLAPGNYVATVSSVSAGEGKLRSAPFAFAR